MVHQLSPHARIVALGLLVTVATQIVYFLALSDVGIVEGWPLRSTLWAVETIVFALVAATAFAALPRDPERGLVWGLLGVSGVFNALQSGIGLSMFLPLTEAGEDFAPVLSTVVAGAFLFYLLAKAMIGAAGLILGARLFRSVSGGQKAVGAITAIAGLAALGTGLFALPQGMAFIFPAGAAGTVATLLVGLCLLLSPGEAVSRS
ncbi:MAG: hypothetical protein RLN87_04330 [Parasphingopyxis sp.]|uniref:hypothetical protein n=1 Tax=Parasphingopyxis sp. TaxID=1920299 RepID=UPI0032EBF2F5